MFGTISKEIEVKASAREAWKVYGTLLLKEVLVEHLPQMIHKIDLLEGDGGAGTVFNVTLAPGTNNGISSYKKKLLVVDDEKLVKVVEVVEGGYLNLGLESYRVKLEIIEKEKDEVEDSCITRATVEYKTQDLAAAGIAVNSIQICLTFMNTVAEYLTKKQNSSD